MTVEVLIEVVTRVALDLIHAGGAAVVVVMSGFEAALEAAAVKVSSHCFVCLRLFNLSVLKNY